MINWTAVATGGAAIATAVAAAFTAYMAKETKKSAIAAEKSVAQAGEELKLLEQQTTTMVNQERIARRVLERGSTPLLIPIAFGEQDLWEITSPTSPQPPERHTQGHPRFGGRADGGEELRGSFVTPPEQDGKWFIYVEMRNVGAGPAVAINPDDPKIFGSFWQLYLPGELNSLRNIPIKPSQPVVPPRANVRYVALIEDSEQRIWQYLNDVQSEPWPKKIPVMFKYQDFSLQNTYCVSCQLSLINRKLLPDGVRFSGYDQLRGDTTIDGDLK